MDMVAQKRPAEVQLDKDMADLTQSLGRPSAAVLIPTKTIIERIVHIRNEIEQLDMDLARLQTDIATRIGARK
jgi:hypothetical protein